MSSATRTHLPVLDGVRGLAIALVFTFHCFPLPGGAFLPLDLLLTLKGSFWFGVDLFFVLSGFLITGILIDSRGAGNRLRTFYARRTLRIFPLYYAALLLVFGGLALFAPVRLALDETASLLWFLAYAFNLHIGIHQSWPDSAILNHFWTLCVEEQFYLIWPFLVWATPPKRLSTMMVATIGVSIAVKSAPFFLPLEPVTLATAMPARMDSFAAGGLIAWIYRNRQPERVTLPAKWAFFGSAFVLTVIALPGRGLTLETPTMLLVVPPLLALFFSTLIYLVIHPSGVFRWLAALFRSKPLCWLGTLSYGIYVYHWLIYFLLVRVDAFGWRTDSAWLNTTITAILTLVVSWFSFRFLESPFLRLKDRFVSKKDDSPAGP